MLESSSSVMLWEEFSSVLLLPRCGKFEDQYIGFNAVDCYWTQKQERSKESALRCFLRGNSGRAGPEVLLPAFAMYLPLLSGLYIKLLCSNSPIAMPEIRQDTRRSPALGGTGLLQCLFLPSACVEENLYQWPLLLPVTPGSSLVLHVYLQPCCGKAKSCLS